MAQRFFYFFLHHQDSNEPKQTCVHSNQRAKVNDVQTENAESSKSSADTFVSVSVMVLVKSADCGNFQIFSKSLYIIQKPVGPTALQPDSLKRVYTGQTAHHKSNISITNQGFCNHTSLSLQAQRSSKSG